MHIITILSEFLSLGGMHHLQDKLVWHNCAAFIGTMISLPLVIDGSAVHWLLQFDISITSNRCRKQVGGIRYAHNDIPESLYKLLRDALSGMCSKDFLDTWTHSFHGKRHESLFQGLLFRWTQSCCHSPSSNLIIILSTCLSYELKC